MRHTVLRPVVERPEPGRVPPGPDGLERLAWLMDQAFRIPGTPFRVGLDAILGLFPGAGDVATGVIQAGIVLAALYRYKVPRAVAARMVANVLLDVGVGAIPFVGDAFDAVFKANTRNLRLLQQVRDQRARNVPVATAPSVLFLAGIVLAFVVALALVVIGTVTVILWLIHRPGV